MFARKVKPPSNPSEGSRAAVGLIGTRALSSMRLQFSMLTIVALLSLLASGCSREVGGPMTHEAYIWQRHWTPALVDSIKAGQVRFRAWRVLAAESTASGELIDNAVELAVLARGALPVFAVLRLNGSKPLPQAALLAARANTIVATWRGAGVRVTGIEIDHDCATAQLDAYADLLIQLHAGLAADTALSITALPTWIGAAAFHRVLAPVDTSVLQVHAIDAPRAGAAAVGLFDAKQARRWIDAYAAAGAGRKFQVALPAYGIRVGFDDDGRTIAVEAEALRSIDAAAVRELRVAPAAVATLLHDLEQRPPPGLVGIVWFRLPSEDDRRAWSLSTLLAVMDGKPLQTRLTTRAAAAGDGAHDILIANPGPIDAPLPHAIVVRASACSAADALNGFGVQQQRDGWRFRGPSDEILRAGRERRVGWMRCEGVDGVTIDE